MATKDKTKAEPEVIDIKLKSDLKEVVKEDKIRLSVRVLICLKRINDKRISDKEEANKLRKLNGGGSSNISSSDDVVLRRSARNSGGVSSSSQQPQRLELNGVLA